MNAFHSTRKTVLRAAVPALALLLAACAGDPTPPAYVSGSRSQPAAVPVPSVPADQATFAFEPFTGAPGNIADALSRQIGAEARNQNLRLVRRVGAPASYRINGYLSASGDQLLCFTGSSAAPTLILMHWRRSSSQSTGSLSTRRSSGVTTSLSR